MKKHLLLFALVLISSSYAQNKAMEISYELTEKIQGSEKKYNSKLIVGDQQSKFIWYKDEIDPETAQYDREKQEIVGDVKTSEYEVYKDFEKGILLSNSLIKFARHEIQKDWISMFDWRLTGERKNILGYDCFSAETTFRGRQYKAYYTKTIPFSDGPWKFHGLPGLILQVEDKQGLINLVANNIIDSNETNIPTELNAENALYWNQIVALAKKKLQDINQGLAEKGSGELQMDTSNNIEVYDINELNFYTIEYENYSEFVQDVKRNKLFQTLKTDYRLITSDFESQYEYIEKLLQIPDGAAEYGFNSREGILFKDLIHHEYKDFKTLATKEYIVIDSLPNINWKILPSQTDSILNHKVIKAIAKVKEFYITAWFSKEIPIPSGPDKYWGLPGIILKLTIENTEHKSKEKTYYLAKSIDKSSKTNIQQPKKGTPISEKEYSKKYNELRKKRLEYYGSGVDTSD